MNWIIYVISSASNQVDGQHDRECRITHKCTGPMFIMRLISALKGCNKRPLQAIISWLHYESSFDFSRVQRMPPWSDYLVESTALINQTSADATYYQLSLLRWLTEHLSICSTIKWISLWLLTALLLSRLIINQVKYIGTTDCPTVEPTNPLSSEVHRGDWWPHCWVNLSLIM